MKKYSFKLGSLLFFTFIFLLTACDNAESIKDAPKDSSAVGVNDTEISKGETEKTVKKTENKKDSQKNSVVATVNETEISRADFDNALMAAQQQFASIGAVKNNTPDGVDIEKEVMDRLIDIELMLQDAKKRKVTVSDVAVDSQMAGFLNSFKTEKEFDAYLKKNNITEDIIKAQFSKQMILQQLQSELLQEMKKTIDVTQETSKAFYDDNLEKFKSPDQVKASHILIKLEKDSDEAASKKALATIETLRKQTLDGEDFAELAKKNSEGPSGSKGGELGFFGRGQMVKPFDEAAFSLKPGEISEVVKTQFGYHIIKVTEKRAAGITPFEEMEEKITNYLFQTQLDEAQRQYTIDLRDDAKIVVNI